MNDETDGLRGPWHMSGRAYYTARYGYVVLENAVPTRLTTALRQEIHAEVSARCGVTLGSAGFIVPRIYLSFDKRAFAWLLKTALLMMIAGERTLWSDTRQCESS